MAKELYLYSAINSYTAELLVGAMEEFKAEDQVIRMITPGGSVVYGWGIISKMQEREGKLTIKVDGAAQSMGLYMLPFADYVEASDVATGLLHRADGYVSSPEDQKYLDDRNKDLRTKFALRIDEAKLKELKGITLDDVFASDKRIDVSLSAKEMKAIGLVDKIVKLTPKETEAISIRMFDVAAQSFPKAEEISKPNNKVMTLEKFKAEHPELYNQIIALGVGKEQDRVGAWMAFVDVDAKAVADGIKSNLPISMTATAELSRKSFSVEALKKLTEEGKATPAAGAVAAIAATEKTDAQKEIDAYEKEVKAQLKGTSSAFVSKTAEV